eukprot:754122-Hanusia_phi.AAC.1
MHACLPAFLHALPHLGAELGRVDEEEEVAHDALLVESAGQADDLRGDVALVRLTLVTDCALGGACSRVMRRKMPVPVC